MGIRYTHRLCYLIGFHFLQLIESDICFLGSALIELDEAFNDIDNIMVDMIKDFENEDIEAARLVLQQEVAFLSCIKSLYTTFWLVIIL